MDNYIGNIALAVRILLFSSLCMLCVNGCKKPVGGYGNLEGRVTYTDGTGLGGVSVIYGDSVIVTSPEGEYFYESIPEGIQGVRFALNGYYSIMELVNIPKGGTASLDVTMEIITSGWAAGAEDSGYGTILHTSDAGVSWIRQGTSSTVPSTRLTDVCAVSDMVCWIVGDADTLHGTAVILRTDDGGSTWTNQGTSLRTLSSSSMAAVISLDGDTAWAVAADTCIVLKTTNAGSSWSECRVSEAVLGYTSVTTYDGVSIWCCGTGTGGNTVVEYSPDGGTTWEVVDVSAASGAVGRPASVCAVYGAGLYLAGTDMMGVLYSGDMGKTWSQAFVTDIGILSLEETGGGRLWASGTGGHLLWTADGFATRTDIQPAESAYPGGDVTSVSFLRDGMHGAFAVKSQSGATGAIFYTVDGGGTWSASTVPFNFCIENLDFVGGNN